MSRRDEAVHSAVCLKHPGPVLPALLLALFLLSVFPAAAQSGPPQAGSFYNQGRAAMAREDWYAAAEALLECVRLNPAHAEGTAALAECYYELGEFDQALSWVRKARTLARVSMPLANLEASILISLGALDQAQTIIGEILAREPYNIEALFAGAELDVARGRAGDAVIRYREVARRFPDDRRLLLSLALVLGSLGDLENARTYIDRALLQHREDYRVYYYAAYLDAQAGRLPQAIARCEQALGFRPAYKPARALLASLRYRAGQYDEASQLADQAIQEDRNDVSAWYLKGMALKALGRNAEAVSVLSQASGMDPNDEFVRAALEDLIAASTGLEDPLRARWAAWHFGRARDYRTRNLTDQALFEYRRGLRINPYARDRREYAELLRLQGYPARYLEELRFLKSLNLTDPAIDDAIEAYDALLTDALYRRWNIDPVETAKRHWKLAVFSIASQSAFYHADAGTVGSAYIRDLLIHDRNMASLDLELKQPSFSAAFRAAREAGADYFLILTVSENQRDLSLKGELFVGRTGSPAATFAAYRTGDDRLRNASRGLVEQLGAALPFRAELIQRRSSQGLIDKGRVDGVRADTEYELVKKGQAEIRNEGIGLVYSPSDVVGKLKIDRADEEVATGILTRQGFFDRIGIGDEIILQSEKPPPAQSDAAADPELRSLLRTLR
ncbi:tetratricopeptide repeat protein [Treponema primitia ZAS-2]|uniref:Tetratricopeptide repeat protein n=1 Tax=Treponema primitia (strain ATCC BAA-887 / DSM 12427 / ZAS-2) TaxID=545694 RepID=F5YMX7_TREPZ|nr:tetratricopeptide repeat protein [Treponema primitia]AEF86990.1 tetratricopeptide repeat protein [Treponema primitia ZAS-2]